MAKIAIVYYSGYGHTRKQAQAVYEGIHRVPGAACELIAVNAEGVISDSNWTSLDAADAIIFGAPTYMAAPPWQMKRFIDATSKRWYTQAWKDKLAGAFTNSGSMNGDKGVAVGSLFSFAMQHGMIWVGTGLLPSASKEAARNDPNFLGGYAAALAQSPSDASADEAPPPGDLETASLFGQRIAEVALRFKR